MYASWRLTFWVDSGRSDGVCLCPGWRAQVLPEVAGDNGVPGAPGHRDRALVQQRDAHGS